MLEGVQQEKVDKLARESHDGSAKAFYALFVDSECCPVK